MYWWQQIHASLFFTLRVAINAFENCTHCVTLQFTLSQYMKDNVFWEYEAVWTANVTTIAYLGRLTEHCHLLFNIKDVIFFNIIITIRNIVMHPCILRHIKTHWLKTSITIWKVTNVSSRDMFWGRFTLMSGLVFIGSFTNAFQGTVKHTVTVINWLHNRRYLSLEGFSSLWVFVLLLQVKQWRTWQEIEWHSKAAPSITNLPLQ